MHFSIDFVYFISEIFIKIIQFEIHTISIAETPISSITIDHKNDEFEWNVRECYKCQPIHVSLF